MEGGVEDFLHAQVLQKERLVDESAQNSFLIAQLRQDLFFAGNLTMRSGSRADSVLSGPVSRSGNLPRFDQNDVLTSFYLIFNMFSLLFANKLKIKLRMFFA